MHSIDDTLRMIDQLLGQRSRLMQERANLDRSSYPKDIHDSLHKDIGGAIQTIGLHLTNSLQQLVHFPPHHERHADALEQFLKVASFEKSVFIMTKFPDGQSPGRDKSLRAVIEIVRDCVSSCGFTPRLASDHEYHPRLWDNVELYLLGCSRAIAIVEGRSKGELNPNVAMEWGWMLGTGRKVLYLVEEKFAFQRADWSGLVENRFQWDSPRTGIARAVQSWLSHPASAIDMSELRKAEVDVLK